LSGCGVLLSRGVVWRSRRESVSNLKRLGVEPVVFSLQRGLMLIRPGIEVASLSDLGCQRENNEDALSYWEPQSEDQFLRKGRLALVADGMGGYEGGQEASRLAVDTIRDVYDRDPSGNIQNALVSGFRMAHERIRQYAEVHPELQGMGTTCTAVALNDLRLYFAHVGDSRLYLVREDMISRLTRDHSYVGRLVESGVLSSEEAERHPQRHILTAALGAGGEVNADVPDGPMTLKSGDILVLCTDGLWGLVQEAEILKIVTANDARTACDELVKLARQRGGPDNITLQVLRVSNNGVSRS
jgi:serine/threonine protein phosphatase PrpC